MLALQIDTDRPTERIRLPDDPAARDRSIAARLSSVPDRGVYHRRAVMLTHGNGASEQLAPNLLATALASAWRGFDLGSSYFLYGRVLLVGESGGRAVDLEGDLLADALAVEEILIERFTSWRRTPPVSNRAAWAEVVTRALTADLSAGSTR